MKKRRPQKPPVKGEPLSPREKQIMRLVCHALSNREIAQRLGVSESTVRNLLHRVFVKAGARSRLHLACYAYYTGIVKTKSE